MKASFISAIIATFVNYALVKAGSCPASITDQGYPCCSTGCTVYYTDNDGDWGVENNQWCGCGNGNNVAKSECPASITSQGYECCSENCEIVYTDDDGNWGVENNQWCGCGNGTDSGNGNNDEENFDNYIYSGTWASSQYSAEGNMPNVSLRNSSIRQIVRTSVEGEYLRFHFSNFLGNSNLELRSVHVAKSASQGTGKIIKDTDTVITFDGKESVTIPAQKEITSDTIKFSAPALTELAVTIYYGNIPNTMTSHVASRANSFIESGNAVSKESISTNNKTLHWYTLSAIDVFVNKNKDYKAVVCFGDSITDGRGVTNDKNNRWTDILATRLQQNPATKNIGVLNQGIGATTVAGTYYNPTSPAGQARFEKDVLKQTNVKYLIILYGVNDILYNNSNAQTIINVYKDLIKKAHNNGIKVFGGTILPFGKNSGFNSNKESQRTTVNNWIMNTPASQGGFDGYIDFASAVADKSNKQWLNTNWNFENDGLHQNAFGYEDMDKAIDLNLFM